MIVLKENEWAKEMIRSGDIGKRPKETFRRVYRYYLDNGYSPSESRKKLETFLLTYDPSASIVRWEGKIDEAIKSATKNKAMDIDGFYISKTEIAKIDALDGTQTQRLAFTLLCLAKVNNLFKPNNDGWISYKDSEIMAEANISTSIKRRCFMYRQLEDAELVRFSKKIDSTAMQILFADDGEPAIYISDMRNLGYQYMMYRGKPYFKCENCGITTKIKNPQNNKRQKYCSECAYKVKIRQTVDAVMKQKAACKTEKRLKNGGVLSRCLPTD